MAEFRAVVQPPSVLGRSMHEHWAGLLYMRRLSPYLTRALVPTRISPDAVTIFMFLAGVAAAAVLTVPAVWAIGLAILLLQLQLLLDCSDGELARWRNAAGNRSMGSVRGIYLDGLAHSTTDAALVVAVGIHADGGFSSLGGWTLLGMTAGLLVLLVHAESDWVHVARAKAGLGLLEVSATVPSSGFVRRMRRALTRLPVNRLLSAWDLSFVLIAVAFADLVTDSLTAARLLTGVLVAVGVYVVIGHLVSVLASKRLAA